MGFPRKVAVILTLHHEGILARPTISSLNQCAAVAKSNNISTELVVVFDKPNDATVSIFQTSNTSDFDSVETLFVEKGSAGLARNIGLEKAQGEYVWIADGDDLLSSNCIIRLLETVTNSGYDKIISVPEYLIAFGEDYHIARFQNSDLLLLHDFAVINPYPSRLFMRREFFLDFPYRDIPVSKTYAHEDWDLNVRLFGDGFRFLPAPETSLFYRQRKDSLSQQADRASTRTIPHSQSFEPDFFCDNVKRKRGTIRDLKVFFSERTRIASKKYRDEYLSNAENIRAIIEANALDPEVNPERIESSTEWSPIPLNQNHWGMSLEKAYRFIGFDKFSDILILPWLIAGGAEKYFINLFNTLSELQPSLKLLLVTGQSSESHDWVQKLPLGSSHLDLYNAFPHLSDNDRVDLLVRLLLGVKSANARIHVSSSSFAHHVLIKYGSVLGSEFKLFYYRFSDRHYHWGNRQVIDPWTPKLLRSQVSNIHKIITDNKTIIDYDDTILGISNKMHEVLYSQCDDINRPRPTSPNYRILWASRLSDEKNIPQLIEISKELSKISEKLVIHVYGNDDAEFSKSFQGCPGLKYMGQYDGFECLPLSKYDIFLYTTHYDGIPNVLLESMSAGFPVIAPAVGGISELISDRKTGYLIQPNLDQDKTTKAYLNVIRTIYDNLAQANQVGENAKEMVRSSHSKEAFIEQVKRVLIE